MVRFEFLNIPPLQTFINRRVWTFIGKTFRSDDSNYSKKMLGAWIHSSIAPRRACHPQTSLRNTLSNTIQDVLEVDDEKCPFKIWAPLAKDENKWDNIINNYFESFKGNNLSDEEKTRHKRKRTNTYQIIPSNNAGDNNTNDDDNTEPNILSFRGTADVRILNPLARAYTPAQVYIGP
jgi:hypothetical protein